MPLIIFLAALIISLGIGMDFGPTWIAFLIICFIIALTSGPLDLAFLRKLMRKSQEKQEK